MKTLNSFPISPIFRGRDANNNCILVKVNKEKDRIDTILFAPNSTFDMTSHFHLNSYSFPLLIL